MPPGLLATDPLPTMLTPSPKVPGSSGVGPDGWVGCSGSGSKVAVTFRSWSTKTVHCGSRPEQAPPQPSNLQPGSGVAVSVTVKFPSLVSSQSPGQSMLRPSSLLLHGPLALDLDGQLGIGQRTGTRGRGEQQHDGCSQNDGDDAGAHLIADTTALHGLWGTANATASFTGRDSAVTRSPALFPALGIGEHERDDAPADDLRRQPVVADRLRELDDQADCARGRRSAASPPAGRASAPLRACRPSGGRGR